MLMFTCCLDESLFGYCFLHSFSVVAEGGSD
jgi:hypothetical protein